MLVYPRLEKNISFQFIMHFKICSSSSVVPAHRLAAWIAKLHLLIEFFRDIPRKMKMRCATTLWATCALTTRRPRPLNFIYMEENGVNCNMYIRIYIYKKTPNCIYFWSWNTDLSVAFIDCRFDSIPNRKSCKGPSIITLKSIEDSETKNSLRSITNAAHI